MYMMKHNYKLSLKVKQGQGRMAGKGAGILDDRGRNVLEHVPWLGQGQNGSRILVRVFQIGETLLSG